MKLYLIGLQKVLPAPHWNQLFCYVAWVFTQLTCRSVQLFNPADGLRNGSKWTEGINRWKTALTVNVVYFNQVLNCSRDRMSIYVDHWPWFKLIQIVCFSMFKNCLIHSFVIVFGSCRHYSLLEPISQSIFHCSSLLLSSLFGKPNTSLHPLHRERFIY